MKKGWLFVLLTYFFSASALPFDSEKLDQYLSTLDKHDKAMLSLAILEDGQPIYQNSIGFVDLKNKQKANENTQYRIGSISKVFTAVMIFQLIDEGKLSLESKLSMYFPKVKNANDISISMLLNHSSGIQNFTDAPEYLQYMTQPKTKAQMLSLLASLSSDFEPNSQAKYSNSGYLLLGYIIENITNESYAEQLQKRVATKLNLSRTAYGKEIDVKDNQAQSYAYNSSGWSATPETHLSIPHGAGAIISTPTEVAIFLNALFEGKLVSKDSLSKMKQINQGFGRGLFQFPFYDKKAYGHTGGIDGFKSQAAYFDTENVTVALTANALNYPINDISIAVLSIYFGRDYVLPDFNQKPIDLSKSDLSKYEGVFASNALPLKIIFKVKDGQLTAQATGQSAIPLTAFSSSDFRFSPAGIIILFETKGDEVDYANFYLKQGGGNFKFSKE